MIEYLEKNGYEWTTNMDTLNGEEILVVDARNYIGSFRYILYRVPDICYFEDRYVYGISQTSLINHLEAKYEQIGNLEWADFSYYGFPDSLMVIHEVIKFENDKFGWRITPNEANPRTAKGFFTRSMARFKHGYYHEAIRDFGIAMKLDKDYPSGDYAEVIKVLILVGEDEAESLYDSVALGIDHGPIDYWIQGLIKANENDIDAAIEAFSNTLDADPGFVEAYYSRGWVYGQKGAREKAIADFTAYIDLFPEAYNIYHESYKGCIENFLYN